MRWGEIDDKGNKHYPLHEAQVDVINSRVRFTAAVAGTGGGKTVLGPIWIALQIERLLKERGNPPNPPILGMVLAPTYKVLSRATVPTLIDTLAGTSLQGVYKETKSLYVLPNGIGRIWCQGTDNPGGIEGGQFDFIWGDEAGQFKNNAWIAIQGRTGQKQAPVLFTTTPYFKNWLYKEIFERYLKGDPDYYVRQWASFYNPAYPREEYERAKAGMSKTKGLMRYDGQFVGLEGLVYPNFDECIVEADPKEVIEKGIKFIGGMDFGWNDPFAAICGIIDSDNILWVWYERYKSETPIEKHADALPKFYGKSIKWFCEHHPEFIKKLRKGGHKAIKANKNILVGIEAVNARIDSGRLKVLKNRCPALIEEANMYHYPEDDEVIRGDKPDTGQDDHALDALRYMVVGNDVKTAA